MIPHTIVHSSAAYMQNLSSKWNLLTTKSAGASEGSEQTKHWRGKPLFTTKAIVHNQWLAPPMLCLLRAFRRPCKSVLKKKSFYTHYLHLLIKSTGRDRSWMGDCCMWTLPYCTRHVLRARSLLAPESWREYPARTSLVSPLHTGVVDSRHTRAT